MYHWAIYLGKLVLGFALISIVAGVMLDRHIHTTTVLFFWSCAGALLVMWCERSRRKAKHEASRAFVINLIRTTVKWIVVMVLLWFVGIVILDAISAPRGEAIRRGVCRQRLHDIGFAIHYYHEARGRFPPAYVVDKDGQPLYSWRILLLPYLDERELYDQFRLDEPWNSPHNRVVTARMPDVYHCLADPANNDATTSFLMIVGPGTVSDGPSSIRPEDISDSLANTIIVVEVADSSVHWAEPRDLDVADMSFQINDPNGKGISSHHPGGANVLLCDGYVYFLRNSTDPQLVQALTTVAGGENLPNENEDWKWRFGSSE